MNYNDQLTYFLKLISSECNKIIRNGVRDHHDHETQRKICMLNIFLFFGIGFLQIMGTVAIVQQAYLLFAADLLMSGVFLSVFLYLRYTGNETVASQFGVMAVFSFFLGLFIHGGVHGTASLWVYTFPFLSLYLLGAQTGHKLNLLLFSLCALYLTINVSVDAVNIYTLDFAARFLPSFLAVCILAWLVERSRSKTVDDLRVMTDLLEVQVRRRTSELENLNKQLLLEIEERKNADKENSRLQIELKQAEKLELVGKLAGGVAHDLNNVLSGIVSYPDLLINGLPTNSKQRGPLEKIKKSGIRAAAIIDDLLSLTRQVSTKKTLLNLNDVISEHFDSTENLYIFEKYPNIKIIKDIKSNISLINGSSVHLQKVIMNLLMNSAEAIGGQPGSIVIKTGTSQYCPPGSDNTSEWILLSISDSGSGISADDIEKIFEPFYTRKVMGRSGTGLGMTIVAGVIQDHAGHISIDSTPQEGTTIKIYLPAATQKIKHEEISLSITLGNGENILLVDDEKEQRDIGYDSLITLNYNCICASSGRDAIEIIKDNSIDLILLDMIMSDLDGLATLKIIKSTKPDIPVILVSGYAEEQKISEAKYLGAEIVVRKPYSLIDLSVAIKNHISKQPNTADLG